jgi:hypothetical protein
MREIGPKSQNLLVILFVIVLPSIYIATSLHCRPSNPTQRTSSPPLYLG